MLQRHQLSICPEYIGKWEPSDTWPDHAAKNRAFAVFAALDTLTLSIFPDGCIDTSGKFPALRFAPDAQGLWDRWRTAWEERIRSYDMAKTPGFQSHLGKYRSLVPSLAPVSYTHLTLPTTHPV